MHIYGDNNKSLAGRSKYDVQIVVVNECGREMKWRGEVESTMMPRAFGLRLHVKSRRPSVRCLRKPFYICLQDGAPLMESTQP